jgi:hypothetical protein
MSVGRDPDTAGGIVAGRTLFEVFGTDSDFSEWRKRFLSAVNLRGLNTLVSIACILSRVRSVRRLVNHR